MILYVENPKKLLKLINEFGKIAGYKINVQKLIVVLHTYEHNEEYKMK